MIAMSSDLQPDVCDWSLRQIALFLRRGIDRQINVTKQANQL
jgi:hypothetical protein